VDVKPRGIAVALAAASIALATTSCASSRTAAAPVVFVAPGGELVEPPALLSRARWTVLVFFSPDCHCVAAHEGRLRELEAEYRGRGVQFFWVDSEVGASEERDIAASRRRGLTFPILRDPHARAARRFDARYASDSVVLDAGGVVHYHGGIDSDRDHLRAGADPYLRNALEDLLGGREPRVPRGPALGCTLQTW
jgi:hypothetical protein